LAYKAKLRGGRERQSGTVDQLSNGRGKRAWRLLDTEYDDPVVNLGIEEAIMEKVGAGESPNTLRFWRNLKTVVVVGKFQIPDLEVNKEACRKYSATVVRRFTGGGTVYHDEGNLNYSVAVRRDDPIVSGMIAEITPKLCKGVVEGLRMLGLNAELEHEGVYIHINGKKVSGTAGIVKRTVAFIHGTLLVDSDTAKLKEILDVPPYLSTSELRRFVRSVRREVTSIRAELGREVTMHEVKNAIKKGFAKALGVELKPGNLLESELLLSQKIASSRYDDIMIRSP
jgi:lipoate-protein ligase A